MGQALGRIAVWHAWSRGLGSIYAKCHVASPFLYLHFSLPLKLRPSLRRNFFWSNDGVNGDRSRSGPQQGEADAQNRGTIM